MHPPNHVQFFFKCTRPYFSFFIRKLLRVMSSIFQKLIFQGPPYWTGIFILLYHYYFCTCHDDSGGTTFPDPCPWSRVVSDKTITPWSETGNDHYDTTYLVVRASSEISNGTSSIGEYLRVGQSRSEHLRDTGPN